MTENKRKVFLVPHSHWDREWYFTFDTSNVLLNSNFVEFENSDKKKWFMDGQWSLVDDLMKWKHGRKEIIKDAIEKKIISVGPLYSQPDVFNSQGETIIRNFEIGNKMANELGVKQLKTAYLPDTFGFGENLPQILKHCNLDNFVFWRGLNEKTLSKNDYFNWVGIDGTKIKSFVLKNGYYSLGSFYPYNAGKIFPKKNDPKYFLTKAEKVISGMSGNHDSVILPLGGDQAPFMYYQDDFVKMINNYSDKYEFELVSDYDKFMESKKIDIEYKGNLRTPISGKIHRTISSSRYDIKKEFRDAEDKLFYLLEPLEIYYQSKDHIYDFERYKDETILKPLLIAQTHDSLGGCNTDITNSMQVNRIERVRQNIDSQIDLLVKKLLQSDNVKDETLAIFNPAPFKNDLMRVMTVYSKLTKDLSIELDNLVIKSLKSKNISLNPEKPLYENRIVIVAKNLKPLSMTKFDISKSIGQREFEDKEIKINNNILQVELGLEKLNISLELIEDKGDSYDFSPGSLINSEIKWGNIVSTKLLQHEFILIDGWLNDSPFELNVFKSKEDIKVNGTIKNKFKNTRVSIKVEQENDNPEIKKSLNLALTDFIKNDFRDDWKESFKEFPANVDVNDGIITLNKKINIYTKGNNEIYKSDKGVKIVLFRTYNDVTGKDLEWRPSTSGLSWSEESPDSQLQKELHFDIQFSIGNTIEKYNKFKFEPYPYKVQDRNFIANKMTKFVINNILKPKTEELDLSIENKDIFISSMRKLDEDIIIRASNMKETDAVLKIMYNNKSKEIKFNKYEIKKIKL